MLNSAHTEVNRSFISDIIEQNSAFSTAENFTFNIRYIFGSQSRKVSKLLIPLKIFLQQSNVTALFQNIQWPTLLKYTILGPCSQILRDRSISLIAPKTMTIYFKKINTDVIL